MGDITFKNLNLLKLVIILGIFAFVGFGCGGGGGDEVPMVGGGNEVPEVGGDDQGQDIVLTSSFVTIEKGGLLHIKSNDDELDGASVDIPSFAVAEKIKISFSVRESMPKDSPYGQNPVGKVFELEPSGTHFDKNVTITLPVPSADTDIPLYIGRWNEIEKRWENLGGTIEGDFISTTIDHLSIYAIFYSGKSDIRIVNEADPTLADLGVLVTYESGPAIFSYIEEDASFPAYRLFPESEVLLKSNQFMDMALLPGRYRFMINYPHPQPGRGNNLYFSIPILNTGADDGEIDQTIAITMNGASSTDSFTNDSIDFPGYIADAADNLRPILKTCNAIVPAGVPVIDALTGFAPTETTHIINVGPIKSEQVASGSLTLLGRATDPENYPILDAYWTEGNRFIHYVAAPGENIKYDCERTKGGLYTVYLTLYDEYDLFDQCQWNIIVTPDADPYVDVVVDDTVVDFGRLDGLRRNNGAVPAPPVNLPNIYPDPFGLHLQTPIPSWGVYTAPALPGPPPPAAQGNPTASTDLKRILTIPATNTVGHFNPIQYPDGMTMVYAIVADADGDSINAGFVLPAPITGKGNLYTAINIPGVPAGTLIDSYATLAAYNKRLTQLANLGWLSIQPHQVNPEGLLPYAPPLPGTLAATIESTQITAFPATGPITFIREPREFPYVIGFNNGSGKISAGDIVTEAINPLGLTPRGKVHKVMLKKGSWTDGDARGYLWMIPVLNDFWDRRHSSINFEPELFVNGEHVATVSYVGQALPIIWEAPDDPNVEQTTHDRRHIYPNVIPAGGKLNIEGRVTDNITPQQRAFAWVAWPDDIDEHCHDIDGDGYFAETNCETEVDCDDENAEIHPGATEICDDTLDNDCDEMIDCNDSDCADNKICKCIDADSDGYFEQSECGTEVDCNDNDKEVNPGAAEICDDEKDNDCDGKTDCDDNACENDSACQSLQVDCNEEYEFYHELELTLNKYCGVTGVGLICSRYSFYNCSNTCVSTTYWPNHSAFYPDARDIFNSTACSSYPGYVSCASSAFNTYIGCLEVCNATFLNGQWGTELLKEIYILQNDCASKCQEEMNQTMSNQCVAK